MNPAVLYAIFTCISCLFKVLARSDIVSNTQNNEEINENTEDLPKKIDLLNFLTNLEPFLTEIFNKELKSVQGQFFQKSIVSLLSKIKRNLDAESDFEMIWKSVQDSLLTYKEDVRENKENNDEEINQQQTKIKRERLNLDRKGNYFADKFSEISALMKKTSEQRNPRSVIAKKITKESIELDESFQDSFLDLPALVEKHGFQAKEYTVQTEDGYLLGLHRMWKATKSARRDPVLLMHGLLQSGDCWLGAGSKFGLAYLLAQDGHDVWIGNVRGNHYSRAHVTLDPGSSSFWQFCPDEHGKFDLPAIIDKVLNETGAEKLNYVGFSQGGGIYPIMCSELPHYCRKANVVVGISPSGRHLMTRSLVFRLLWMFYENNEKELHDAGIYEVFPKNGLVQKFSNFFCRRSDITLRICELMKDLLDGHHPGSFTKASILNMVSSSLAGTSVHNMARYSQSLRYKSIYKFDYGLKKNLQLYGSPNPPEYNLSATTVPVVVIYGRNDGLSDIDDIKWLVQQLPNVIEAYEVKDALWTHLDGIYSQYVPKLLYPKVKEYLNKIK